MPRSVQCVGGLRTCSSLICNASVQFQMKIRKISRRRSRSPKYPELGHFTLLFCRRRLRNVQRTCTATVLLIKPFVSWRSRCCCRRSLLKVPISSIFLFSYLILYITHRTSAKEKFDFDKMQSFLEVLKSFKFAAILVHHSHQSSLRFE